MNCSHLMLTSILSILSTVLVCAEPDTPKHEPAKVLHGIGGIPQPLLSLMFYHGCPGHYKFTAAETRTNGVLTAKKFTFVKGGPMGEIPYQGGQVQGTIRYWSEAGHLLAELPFKEGKLHGFSRYYDFKGKLLGTSEFKHGTGTCKVWHRLVSGDKKLAAEIDYKDGAVVKRRYFD